jgi:hypothetical protein
MLDVVLLIKAVLAGALTASVVMQLAAWGAPRPWRIRARWSWAVGAGTIVASGITDQWPHWPTLEDRARFLTLVVPLTLAMETLVAGVRSRRVAWTMRLTLAACVAPILLHDSVYLVASDGRDAAEWPPLAATIILCMLTAALTVLWALFSALQLRTTVTTVHWVLALDALAASVTVMLSGYLGAGLLGLGLAGAISGAALASSRALCDSTRLGSLAMSVVGIFAVVLMGRFFGSLPTGLAAGLLLAPLAAWSSELPGLRTMPPRWQAAARLTCPAVVLLLIVGLAVQNFRAASAARPGPLAPTAAEP